MGESGARTNFAEIVFKKSIYLIWLIFLGGLHDSYIIAIKLLASIFHSFELQL